MNLTESVFAVLLSLPGVDPAYADTTAHAIATAAPTPERAALLISVGYHESKFMPRIGRGECLTYTGRGGVVFRECDAGRARGFWQVQRTSLAPEFDRLLGLDVETVTLAAVVADRILQRGRRACRTTEGSVSYFARGNCRIWPGAKRRALLAESIERRLTGG